MNIKVCDAPMGAGKTSAAINYINEHTEKNFLFITPYLNEVDRVLDACAERQFVTPVNKGRGKLNSLEESIYYQRCIASTHALFESYTQMTATLIRMNNYTLILDEVFNVIKVIDIKPKDIKVIFDSGLAGYEEDTKLVYWIDESYDGKFNEIKDMALSNRLTYFNEKLLLWTFPSEIFQSFNEVIILTYMFDKQVQAYYHSMYDFSIEKLYVRKSQSGLYEFTDTPVKYDYLLDCVKKIHMCEDAKINAVGNGDNALSKSWFMNSMAKENAGRLRTLKKNISNFFTGKNDAKSNDIIWTTYKAYEKKLAGKGFTKSFVPCNARATNEYGDRHYLAYCANIFVNPIVINYFKTFGIVIDQDGFALTVLIQWIWRSAIRNGEDIWVYIPSARMREIFMNWIESLKEGK